MNHKKRSDVFCIVFTVWLSIFLCGCLTDISISTNMNREEVEYVICKDSNLPGQLQDLLEEKKKKAGTFIYKNSLYMYLVVCYGTKVYSGYSIQVEECSRTEDTMYLRTQLLGPVSGEKAVKKETFPYIVLRCERMDVFCEIES